MMDKHEEINIYMYLYIYIYINAKPIDCRIPCLASHHFVLRLYVCFCTATSTILITFGFLLILHM